MDTVNAVADAAAPIEFKPRLSRRYRVKVVAILVAEDGSCQRAYTGLDVSRGGMCLDGPSVVPVGERVRVWLVCGRRTIALAAAVVWTSATQCGIEFAGQQMGMIGASAAMNWSDGEPVPVH
jgi:hypothetical protein